MVASTSSGTSVPVFQFISEAHDSKTIEGRLKNWAEDLTIPKEIVIDGSSALLLSLIRTFTQYVSTKEYLDQCHKLLLNHCTVLPLCYIRHDVAHYIKILRRNKIYEKVGPQIKTFYLNCLGLLFWATDFSLIKDIVKNILILSICKYQEEENQDMLDEAKSVLFKLIQTHKSSKLYKNEEDDDDQNDDDNDDENRLNDGKNHFFWYDEIHKRIENNTRSEDDENYKELNMYCFPKFAAYFRTIVYALPLWGGAMVNLFKSPNLNVSSANQESAFRYIKNNLFKFVGKQRADAFTLSHINLIGSTKIAVANLNNYNLTTKNKFKTNPPSDQGKLV